MCKGTLLYRSVDYGLYQESALPAAERADGRLLLCCATPLTDLEVEYVPTMLPGNVRVDSSCVTDNRAKPCAGSRRHAPVGG